MDTKSEIEYYLEQKKTNGALMIKGAWGCGKTFFLKAIKDDYNKGNEYAVVILSLFDINSPEALEKKIKQEIAYVQALNVSDEDKRTINNTKFKEKASAILSAFEDCCGLAKSANALLSINFYDFISIENTVNCFDKNDKTLKDKQLVLIFDDFERCEMTPKQLLGIVNEFVENRGIKTIIVADETKIEDEGYYDFKEKAISRTITFDIDHSDIIKTIIEKYPESDNGYSAFLKKNEKDIIECFESSQYDNLRTVITAIDDFKRIYDVWLSFGRGTEDISRSLYQFIAISSEFKAGKFGFIEHYNMYMIKVDISHLSEKDDKKIQQYQREERHKIEQKYRYGTFNTYLMIIAKWIVDSEWNEDEFKSVLEEKYPFHRDNIISTFFDTEVLEMSSDDVREKMTYCIEKSYSGEMSIDEYRRLLRRIRYLRGEIHQSLVNDCDYNKMEEGLDLVISRLIEQNIRLSVMRIDQEEYEDDAKPIAKKINALSETLDNWAKYNEFKYVLFNCNPDTDRKEYLKSFSINVFDSTLCEQFKRRFDAAKTSGINVLSKTIDTLYITGYPLSNLTESCDNLNKLIPYLEEKISVEQDVITIYILKSFIKNLQNKITILNNRIANYENQPISDQNADN